MEFLNYFIDFSAFSRGNTLGIIHSILNLLLLLAPVTGIIYLMIFAIRMINAGSKPEKSIQARNAVLRVLIILIIVYVVYAITRFILDKFLLDI